MRLRKAEVTFSINLAASPASGRLNPDFFNPCTYRLLNPEPLNLITVINLQYLPPFYRQILGHDIRAQILIFQQIKSDPATAKIFFRFSQLSPQEMIS
jgi:hypothetical protein